MLAEASSPAPEQDVDDASSLPALSTATVQQPSAHQPPHGRKRKRPPPTAASPAPSDPGSASGAVNPSELLSSRVDLSSRPRLSISRGPIFVPTAEGSEYHKTELIGVNRVGFRYVPAGINPPGYTLPCRTIESNPTTYRVSWEDRSPFITVTKDGLGLRGGTGFRSARCNAPIVEGRWYMEVKIMHGGGEHDSENGRREGSHVRLGWGRREAPLNGPVGLDGYSYGYRDKTGDKVTLSRPRPYGRAFGTGDVIGMYISLPPRREASKKDPHDPAHTKRERIPIDLKGQEVFEILEYPQSKEMIALMDYSAKSTSSASVPSAPKKAAGGKPERNGPSTANKTNAAPLRPLPVLHGSRIAFFVNGECQGVAFEDIYDYLQLRQSDTQRKAKERKRTREGVKEHRENPFNDGWLGYYPFISLFNDACVRLNPGPDFEFPPPNDIDALLDGKPVPEGESTARKWRPTCERYREFMAEQWALDEVEEEEAREEAARHAANEKIEAAKRAEKLKKKQQAEARKRAKLAAAEQQQRGTPVVDDEWSPSGTGMVGLGQPSPSPLRHGTTYGFNGEGDVENSYSPAPTPASFQGGQSGYNSDNMEAEMENGEERSASRAFSHDVRATYSETQSPRETNV
ncbi:putative set1 complex component ash2 [Lyophyllum shimeji]|uniref:Set1 complex component ash2 n=1 Tax=Lyophyllum shimeji TaxID=47721 RepID=A0A9P3UIF0_LYOSH|nr:putative set1 complex component ash2 [Lyophyllum shimeji]